MRMSRVEHTIIGVLRRLASLGNLVLVFLMCIAALDIVLRSIFNIAIRGGVELITSSMVALVFLTIPLRCYTNEQIKVDFIDAWAKKVKKRGFVLNSINYLIMLAFSAMMAWQSTVYAILVQEVGKTSMVLAIPTYPFIYLIAFSYLCAFFATLLALKDLWLGGRDMPETEDLRLASIK